MHQTVKNLINIKEKVKGNLQENNLQTNPNIIAVSKTFNLDHIMPLINYGHLHYGENKVQEALEKWSDFKKERNDIKLHLIGKLQTNKVKFAIKIFDYIHSLDNEKLATKIASLQKIGKKNIKLFIQVNIGDEDQKSGIQVSKLFDFYQFCKELNLNIIGLMCIPPINGDVNLYFKKMQDLKKQFSFNELSMGMSSDYLDALKYSSSFLRIGSSIFGKRN
jgi:pyridoxal phosphate enzyme (YggS family)